MQVSVETLNDLERRVTVQVPAERVAKEIQDRLVAMSRKVKVAGFRPGKVPLKIMQRMYGNQVRYEAVSELMEHSLRDALVQEKLNPLGGPKIEPKPLEEGQAFEYSATFEVMPEFDPSGFENIKVERPVAEVTEQDVDHMIETLRQQRTIWTAVERPARDGDRVRFDFEGKIDGQDFAGNKGENAQIVLGGKSLLADFETRLIGLTPGTETEFDLTFPEDYQVKEVAGKTAHFQVKLHGVEEAHLPEVDDAFAEKFDVKEGGVPALRQALRENMERELREGIQAVTKRQVMQGLLEANTVPLPQALIEVEIEQLASQLRFPPSNNDEKIQQLKAKLFETEARRRVALGLLISKLATKQGIQADEERVRARLDAFAATHEEPAEVLRYYEQTPNALDNVRALVLEDQIVDWVLERAQVTEKASTFAEIMMPSQQPVAAPAESVE
ncbi:MAG: trigger factor [Proteobacteria bacterium]|jgi:trigger factor|nr:trigger factor [Pseudomonadota bacterium]MCU0807830.1 trigger factor [Candidatus Contendobacter sp.]